MPRCVAICLIALAACGGSPAEQPAPSVPLEAGALDARPPGQLGDPCDPTAKDATTAGCHYLGAVCFALHTVGDLGAACAAPHAAADLSADYCGRCSYACDTEPSVTTACPALGGQCVQYDLASNAICEAL